jgi:arylsulfatase A-like enzyme
MAMTLPSRAGSTRLLVLASIAVLSQLQADLASAAPPPNIIFIYTDDHTWQAISAYGSRINRTPNVDALAVAGMRFDNCFVTNSICGPMRAAILTSKYSHINGVYVNNNEFDQTQQVFPKLLQAAGYETALIGKWHLSDHPVVFDHSETLIDQGTYYNPTLITNGEPVEHVGYTTHIITDRAIDWLKGRSNPDRPFMLMYQHKAPHRAWDPGPEYLTMYDDVKIPEPPLLFEDYSIRGAPVRQQDMTIAETMDDRDLKFVFPRELTPEQRGLWEIAYGPKNLAFRQAMLSGADLVRWKYQRYIKDYLRCVAAVDDNLGRVLAYLDESGLADNTVVIYTSDQGFYLGEHGWFDKRWMYEQSLRTPLIVRWPGTVEAGTFCDAIVTPLDFAPTFLELAGAEVPADMQGRSLVPLLKGETPPDWRKTMYYHYYEYPGWHHVRRHYGVTDTRFKLIHFYEPDVNTWELYDVKLDPFEVSNVYGNPVYAKVQARLHAELDRLRSELRVPAEDSPDAYIKGFSPRTRPAELRPQPQRAK